MNQKHNKPSRPKKMKGRAQAGKRTVNKGIGFCESVQGKRLSCQFPECGCHKKL